MKRGTTRQLLRRAGIGCGLLMAAGLCVAEPAPGDAEYLSETWRAEDGLPQNTVTCLAQTREGYLWLGTQQGLARFDGVRFRVIDTGNTPELASGRVSTLFEDRKGVLWVGTEGGGMAWTTSDGWHPCAMQGKLGNEVVHAFCEDRDGNMWAGTLSGLCRWQGGSFVAETSVPGLTDRSVGGLARDGLDDLWVLAGEALGRLQDGVWNAPATNPQVKGAGGLFRDRGGSLWIFGKDLQWIARDGHLTKFLAPGALGGQFVTAMCDAQNGDLWLGTRSGGLLRVRGGQVTPFQVSHNSAPSPVRCLLEDREGNLWVGTDGGGLSRLKPRHIKTFTARDGLCNEVITSLAEDGEGGIWVGTKWGGLHRWENGSLAPFRDDPVLPPKASIGPLCQTRDGSLWIGTFGEGLFRLREGRVSHYGLAEGLLDSQVLSLLEDRCGTLWIGTYEGGLYQFQDGRLARFAKDPGFGGRILTSLAQQPNGDLWVGSGGMGVFRLRDGSFEQFTKGQGLGSAYVQTLRVDAAGMLWVGTGGGGLARWVNDRFVSITTEHGLRENVVSQIVEDVVAGTLWLGGNRGLSRVSRAELNEFVAGIRPRVSPLAFGRTDGMESLECAGGFCPAGLRSPDDRLWFATVKGLVQVTPFAIGTTLPGIIADNLSFGDPRLVLAGGGHFDLADAVGGGNGGGSAIAQSIHPATGRFAAAMEQVITDEATTAAGRYHRTASPFIDGVFIPDGGIAQDGRVVISSTGLEVVLPDTNGESWGCISRSAANPNPAHNQRRQTLGEVDYGAPGHSILNMSGNAGVTFDLAAIRAATGAEIERFTATAGNGWVGPASFRVLLDGVQVAYQADVFKDLDHLAAKVFPLDIPLPRTTRFLTLVTTDDKDNPRYANNANPRPPPVLIEEVLVDGNRIPESAATVGGVTVRPGQEQLEIWFTALSFTAPEKVRFRYQLAGFDPGWVTAGEERRARYTKLPPGPYRFQVIACNNDGVWNESGAVLELTVEPPFWRTWWFLGTAAVGAGSLVGGTVRFTTKRRMQRKLDRLRQRHAVEQERTRIARDMHDEIGAKLTKISFLSELAKRDLAHPPAAAAQIDQLSDTARDLIRALDEIVWAVNPKNDTLENLANYICRHAGDYFEHTDVQCQFEIPMQVPDQSLSTDARHNLFLAVKEALHNALKHSGATEVRVRIDVRDHRLAVTLTDNGGGFGADHAPSNRQSAGQRVGNGLANMRQRLESIGGHCVIVSDPRQGTTVTLTLDLAPETI